MYICLLFSENGNTNMNALNSITDLYLLQQNQTPQFYDRTNGSSRLNRNRLYMNKEHKLIFCFIQKNANTMFRNLWFAVQRNDSFIYHIDTRKNKSDPNSEYHKHLHIYNLDNKEILNMRPRNYLRKVNDSDWIKAVIIRDPLERLLSGFLDRCLWLVETYGFTKECFGNITKQFSFNEFVQRMINKTKHRDYITNPHYWPQSWSCQLREYLSEYQFVIKYDYYSIGAETLHFLNYVNLSQYYYKWGQYFNETMFSDTVHVTYNGGNDLTSKIDFYKQYYTMELAVKCLKLYGEDYRLFNMSYPQWIHYLE